MVWYPILSQRPQDLRRTRSQVRLTKPHCSPWIKASTVCHSLLKWTFPGRLKNVSPLLEHNLQSPFFLKMGATTLVHHLPITAQDLYAMLQGRVSQDSPTMSKAFSMSGLISPKPTALPLGVSWLLQLAEYLQFNLNSATWYQMEKKEKVLKCKSYAYT